MRDRMKLLPFPWIFATRSHARWLIECIESRNRIIDTRGRELDRLRQLAGEDVHPPRPACPSCGRPAQSANAVVQMSRPFPADQLAAALRSAVASTSQRARYRTM